MFCSRVGIIRKLGSVVCMCGISLCCLSSCIDCGCDVIVMKCNVLGVVLLSMKLLGSLMCCVVWCGISSM